ncbi:MAG: pyridoxamine 5'-phosphate oxidase family protein [Acidimicrobiia bacterium]|nr:pyridoxamine 5'-phosphate oxidase family protein [Acidimicrobiia bacterium]
MPATTETVWREIDDNIFGVLAFVNKAGEPRSAGIVYAVDDRSLLISSARDSWKNRHITRHPKVSMTVTIPKRVPFLPFIKVPAATVTFHGDAEILEVDELSPEATRRLFKSSRLREHEVDTVQVIRVVPRGEFLTYGIAMPITQMADHGRAVARIPCGTDSKPTLAV